MPKREYFTPEMAFPLDKCKMDDAVNTPRSTWPPKREVEKRLLKERTV